MRLNNSTPDKAVSPHIYSLLDQRLALQGAPLHQLIRTYAAAVPAQPASPEELLNQITAGLGQWAAPPAKRDKPETALAEERLRLMEGSSKIQGPEGGSRLQAPLVRVGASQ